MSHLNAGQFGDEPTFATCRTRFFAASIGLCFGAQWSW